MLLPVYYLPLLNNCFEQALLRKIVEFPEVI